MYENRSDPLLSRTKFVLRVLAHAAFALGIVVLAVIVGILGYHYFEGLAWIDALVESAMLLGGMGPIHQLQTVSGKLFASFYALFAGLVFLVIVGVLLAPLFHRFLHRFNLELAPDDQEQKA